MQKDLHAVWQGILGEVELSLSTPNYTVYWSKTVPISFDGNEIIFEVPNIYVQKNLQTKYDYYYPKYNEKWNNFNKKYNYMNDGEATKRFTQYLINGNLERSDKNE